MKTILVALFLLFTVPGQARDITVTIPDEKFETIVDGFAYQHGYQDIIPSEDAGGLVGGPSIANPETKEEYLSRMLARFIRYSYEAGKVKEFQAVKAQISKDAKTYTADISVNVSPE